MKHRGVVCEKCGVEVISPKFVVSVWAISCLHSSCAYLVFESLPSRIGRLLDMTQKDLEKVLYCEAYMVVDPGATPFSVGDLLAKSNIRKPWMSMAKMHF